MQRRRRGHALILLIESDMTIGIAGSTPITTFRAAALSLRAAILRRTLYERLFD